MGTRVTGAANTAQKSNSEQMTVKNEQLKVDDLSFKGEFNPRGKKREIHNRNVRLGLQ